MAEHMDVTITEEWRTNIQADVKCCVDKLDRVLLVLEGNGTELLPGIVKEHSLIMKNLFGDKETKSMGVILRLGRLENIKSWVSHTLTAGVSIAATCIAMRFFGLLK